jgi:hypothetical protein
MSGLNSRTARVIDPVLSGIAQGYRHAQRVGHILFPRIDVPQRGGNVIEFGRESFFNYKARRAPGADAMNIQFGYEGKPYSLDQYSLDVPVPREHAEEAEVPGIDLGKRAVNNRADSAEQGTGGGSKAQAKRRKRATLDKCKAGAQKPKPTHCQRKPCLRWYRIPAVHTAALGEAS